MKKMMIIILSYVLFTLAICFAVSFFVLDKPELLAYDVTKYTIFQAWHIFFKILPAIVASGFLIGCIVVFSVHSKRIILGYFKNIVLNSVLLASILFIVGEVISPYIQKKIDFLESTPETFRVFVSLSEKNFKEGRMNLAAKYANDALILSPQNKEANELFERAVAANSLEDSFYTHDVKIYDFSTHKENLEENDSELMDYKISAKEFENETLESLIEKSQKAMNEERWFDAHYYAYVAVKSGNPLEENYDDAKILEENAWNEILKTADFSISEEMELFKLKKQAYLLLISGDDIGAYYSFLEISRKSEKNLKDPDVMKYLKIATERVQSQYFFIDEFEDFTSFETDNNVYFSVKHKDKSTDVVHICGITSINSNSGVIKYLRKFTLYSYDENGKFIKSISVPYAKMFSEKIDMFDTDTKKKFDIKDEFRKVPYILLRGIDSKNPEKVSLPEFKFGENLTVFEKEEIAKSNFIVLPLSFDDFNVICDSSIGADKMNFISLWKIFRKAKDFGYSSELFGSNLIRRLTDPIIMLNLFIFLACIAWNYKLDENQIFKFKWIFIVPVCSVILYFILDVIHFVMRALNYFFIGLAGDYSVFIALSIEIVLLVIISTIFIFKE